jgi:hypothetical protein
MPVMALPPGLPPPLPSGMLAPEAQNRIVAAVEEAKTSVTSMAQEVSALVKALHEKNALEMQLLRKQLEG